MILLNLFLIIITPYSLLLNLPGLVTEVTFRNDVTLIKWPTLINVEIFCLLGSKLNYPRTYINDLVFWLVLSIY